MRERFLPVVGYEGHYEVGDVGTVVSIKRGRREIAPLRQASGHLGVGLCFGGAKTRHRVHRLVMATFVGPCHEGWEVRHLDGDPTNNSLVNLAYGTVTENKLDMYRHGGRRTGTRSHLAKYSDEAVAQVMGLKGQVSSRVAAERFGMSREYVSQLWRGESRVHDKKESHVEAHLTQRAKAMGGEVRKLAWVGRKSAPDRLVMLPGKPALFVELKRPGKLATFPADAHERAQLREHERMRNMGQRVVVIDSIEGVEELLA